MYEIIITTWYQDTPDKTYDEVYQRFEHIEDACQYLGDNYKKILDLYPVEGIKIALKKEELPLTDGADIIHFGMWLTGHDEETIKQMYRDWH